MAKNNRVLDIGSLQDPYQIAAIEYNPAAGAEKVLIVGPRLIPIPVVTAGTPGWTTNASTTVALPSLGLNLAIYNNSGAAGSVTTGDIGVTSLAIGAVDANGNTGVACPPNAYTYVSMGAHQYVVTSASTLIVYIIEDPTRIAQETGPYAQQNPGPYAQLPINS